VLEAYGLTDGFNALCIFPGGFGVGHGSLNSTTGFSNGTKLAGAT
jgi:hypothetical protein